MSGTLNQKQIDALLPGVGAAPEVKPAPRAWVFGRPAPLAPAVRARVEALHTRFVRALEVQLATLLQQPAQVSFAGLEPVTGGEFASALEAPGATFALRVGGSDARGAIDFGPELSLALVERLLGGPGQSATRRALTAFEQALVRGVAERALTLLAESWSTLQPTTFECLAFESDPTMLKLAAGEALLASHFEVTLGGERRDLAVALPIGALGARLRGGEGGESPPASRVQIEDQLRRARAEVRVRFPEFRLPTRALLGLQVGQIVHTQHPADAPFEVLVNGRVQHRGVLGQLRRHLGVRVRELVTEADSNTPALREGRIQ